MLWLQKILAAGDMVKIDFGCHVDGYIAVAAHTVVVPDDGMRRLLYVKANAPYILYHVPHSVSAVHSYPWSRHGPQSRRDERRLHRR